MPGCATVRQMAAMAVILFGLRFVSLEVRRVEGFEGSAGVLHSHSIQDHELALPAHKFSAPAAGHFGETVDMG